MASNLRVDTTVVQTDIHHPTDSALLWMRWRVITRPGATSGRIIPRGVSTFHKPPLRLPTASPINKSNAWTRATQTRLAGNTGELDRDHA